MIEGVVNYSFHVTGNAGYIGSRCPVPHYGIDLKTGTDMTSPFGLPRANAVIHLAAFIDVAESVREPEKYFRNNILSTLNLIDAMKRALIPKIVFASSAAVYDPQSPYAWSKLICEWIIMNSGLDYCILRYFNVGGGTSHLGEQRPPITIFGHDYPTFDGTCIRDYVDIKDVWSANLVALNESGTYDVGTGQGTSVKEVLSSKKLPWEVGPRRQGDPPYLVADPSKFLPGWKPLLRPYQQKPAVEQSDSEDKEQ